MGCLDGKIALITGAGAGIGKASALLFAREGASVGLLDHQADSGEAAAKAIIAAGGQALFVATDVSDAAQIESAVAAIASRFGGLDILYNNAGGATARDGKVTDMALDEFWRTIGVDLFGTFLGCRYAIPHLVERGGGSIINTTSIRAMIGTAGADAYTAAKGGVLTLTKSLALQWANKKIRVNAIAPGVVLSERVRGLVDPDDPLY
jgi:NAD(P)-dependent dehydrogenase (short-subunit alcohol dehydrogenase family)